MDLFQQVNVFRARHTEKLAAFWWGPQGAKRERAKRVVHYHPRPVRLAGGGGFHGDAVRGLARLTLRKPVQPRGVAHPPTERGHVAAVGPARVLARARRVRHGRLQVRAAEHDARELNPRRENWREILDRPDVEPHSGEQPSQQLRLRVRNRVETGIRIRVGLRVRVIPTVDSERVCDVIDGGGRREV